jgi:hypothetical protein
MPAALVLRRSHARLGPYSTAKGSPSFELLFAKNTAGQLEFLSFPGKRPQSQAQVNMIWGIEKSLRKYGITSAVNIPQWKQSQVNIQVTRNMEILDFGGYSSHGKFGSNLVLSKPADKDIAGGTFSRDYFDIVRSLDNSSKSYVQPDLKLAVPLDRWGLFGLIPRHNIFLDNMSLTYAAAGDLFKLRAIGKERLLALHCWFMVDAIKRIGLLPNDHSSTKGCTTNSNSEVEKMKEQLQQNETAQRFSENEFIPADNLDKLEPK